MEQSEDSSRSSSLQSLFYLFCPPVSELCLRPRLWWWRGWVPTWAHTSVGPFHFLVPFIDRVAKKVNLKEQVEDFPPQPVITKDNVTMQIDTVVFFYITDPKLYAYGVERRYLPLRT